MEHYYEITNIKTLVEYTRWDKLDGGGKEVKTTQTIVWDGLKTLSELVKEAESRVEPDWDVKVLVADKLK